MRIARFLLSALAAAGLASAQTPPANSQQRDLKLEKIEAPKPPSNAPAHSYAVIVGISLGTAFTLRAAGVSHPATLGCLLGGLLLGLCGPILMRVLRRIMLGNRVGAPR